MSSPSVADLCEQGQELLMRTEYLAAEATLVRAERAAYAALDWDQLSRLYMPLQEARRQRRQRCGEGVVCLDLLSEGPDDKVEGRHVLEHYPHGQLLVAGWGSTEPARDVRAIAADRGLYAETFLAAAYPLTGGGRVVVVAPFPDSRVPDAGARTLDELTALLPPGCLVIREDALPRGPRKGTFETYGQVMALWERLHAPFLAAADAEKDPLARVEAYRKVIRVDYACELAHQRLADVSRELARHATATAAG